MPKKAKKQKTEDNVLVYPVDTLESQPLLSDTENISLSENKKYKTIENLSEVEKKSIIESFIFGKSIKNISEELSVSPHTISAVIRHNNDFKTDIERRTFQVFASRENKRIADIKDKMLNFIDQFTEQALLAENKLPLLEAVQGILGSVDRIQRLNNEKPTDIAETRTLNVDLSELQKNLKNDEDKMEFLRQQMNIN